MPNEPQPEPHDGNVDRGALRGYLGRTRTQGEPPFEGRSTWLVDGIRQVACSNEASGGRCGSRAGEKTCCVRTERSDESFARWYSARLPVCPPGTTRRFGWTRSCAPSTKGPSGPSLPYCSGRSPKGNGRHSSCRLSSSQRNMGTKR